MFTTTLPNFENEFSSHNGFGRILRDENKQLLAIKEFVAATEAERKILEVNPGVYMFNSNWLWDHVDQVKKNVRGEYYLTDLMEIAVMENLPIVTADINPMEVFGINTPQQLAQAEKMI
jgi:bifunctional UDP-N-acetylglucosamine pyrophosphorylase/glucosamine-1-phosphate N-acetyltransferase